MVAPIWKDYYINLGKGEGVAFRIKVGDDVIYTGRAYPKPGEETSSIRINDICADYLQNVLPELTAETFQAMEFPVTFIVESYNTEEASWMEAGTAQFLADWSYDNNYSVDTMGMAFPINGKVDARQTIIYTAYNSSSVVATLTFQDGTTKEVTIDTTKATTTDLERATASAGSGSVVLDLAQYADIAKVTIGNTTYNVSDGCHRYAIHYINAYGGWDALLIEGNDLREDTLTRNTREMVYDNRAMANRGKQNYVNEITCKYTLHTGWLSDDESLRMHHLLNSTEVYLEDIAEGGFHPVTITNTSCQYKTYKNNGGSLVNYEISVELSQNRLRR